jgi:hypothetical protein
MRLIAAFLTFATISAFAAERLDITKDGKKMEQNSAKALWNSAGIDQYSFPQAPGFVAVSTVMTSVFGGVYVVADFVGQQGLQNITVVGEIISANGDVMMTDTWSSIPGLNFVPQLEFWNGTFPNSWPSGKTRFRAVVITQSGNVTEANGYADFKSCCTSSGPQIKSVTAGFDGQHIIVAGNFTAPVMGINGNWASVTNITPSTATPLGTTIGTATVAIPNDYDPLFGNDGNGVLTVCDRGQCSQTFFNIPPVSP